MATAQIKASALRDDGWWAIFLSGHDAVEKHHVCDPDDKGVIDLTISTVRRLAGADAQITWVGDDEAGKRLAKKASKRDGSEETLPTEDSTK
jgi:hypothetical protein